MPLLREYLEYDIDCVIRYRRIHIQWSHEGLNHKASAETHSTVDVRGEYTQCRERGTLSAVPFRLCSGLVSGGSLIPVTGGKIKNRNAT